MIKKRYIAKIDFYVYAESDNEAKKNAQEIAQDVSKIDDNQASVIGLSEQLFGTLGCREIQL